MKNSTPASIENIKEKQLIFFKDFKTQDVKIRIQHLKKLKRVLEEREESIFEALYQDLKKPVFESFTSELLMVQKELDLHIKNIKEWETKGGIGIHHTAVPKTLNELKRLGFK
mgnify:CR=1 FL=1